MPGTHINYKYVRDDLIAKFGANKPLAEITLGDSEDFRRWLATDKAPNTVRRRCGIAKQFLRAAVRKRLITENPFGDMKDIHVKPVKSKDYFVSREDAQKVIDACPSIRWRIIFTLARYGGLRCPSEVMALRLTDVDWRAGKITVRSPKTEHHEGKESRVIPIFPELRPYLEEAAKEAKAVGSKFFVTKHRMAGCNKRTTLTKIIKKAGLKPWPKLFQNLRQTRAIELAKEFPGHVAAEWMGHDTLVAQKHYWRSTEDDFAKARTEIGGAKSGALEMAQKTSQQPLADVGTLSQIVHNAITAIDLQLEECDRVRLLTAVCEALQDVSNCPSRI